MQISRRDFLKTSIPLTGLLFLGQPGLKNLLQNKDIASSGPGEKAMLYDSSKCIGCYACVNACRKQNNLDQGSSYTAIKEVQLGDNQAISYYKNQCMHCTDATCVKVCPTHAVTRNELGFVAFDRDKCIGCGYCAEFCPFHIPKVSTDKVTGLEKMSKCLFCQDRVSQGGQTACSEACPTHALTFGSRDDLVKQGKERVTELVKTYPDATFYGEKELGGLHVMYILKDKPTAYSLPEDPRVPLTAVAWKNIIQPLGWSMGGLVVVGLAMNYLFARTSIHTSERNGKEEK
jgi:formate dehydrogenase iron-sulfur subunit